MSHAIHVRETLVRVAVCAVLAGAVLVGLAGPVFGHVTVNTGQPASQGGYAKLVFRVPNESDSAANTRLQVSFPENAHFGHISVKPQPGWSYEVDMRELDQPVRTEHGKIAEVVTSVTWTADSDQTALKPGEFGEFAVSVGPLPQVDRLVFPATQRYDNGDVVKWNQTAAPGSPEPDNPAPVLDVIAEDAGTDTHADVQPASTTEPAASRGGTSVVAVVALVVAILAAILAALTSAGSLLGARRSKAGE